MEFINIVLKLSGTRGSAQVKYTHEKENDLQTFSKTEKTLSLE